MATQIHSDSITAFHPSATSGRPMPTSAEPFWRNAPGTQPTAVSDVIAQLHSASGRSPQAAIEQLSSLTNELAEVLRIHDRIPIIGQVAHLSAMVGADGGDPYVMFGNVAKVQYLVGVALSADARADAEPGPAENSALLTSYETSSISRALLHASSGTEGQPIEFARRGLQLEKLLRSFPGVRGPSPSHPLRRL